MNIGERIRELRLKTGYSQNALAEKAGVSQTHLRRIELGQADVTVGYLQLVCDALGISISDFFFSNEEDELIMSISHLTPKQKKLLTEFLKSIT